MSEQKLLLNLGCGGNFHPDWTNLDLVSAHPQVQQADLSRGIPFPPDSADAIYHSHLLEHLTPTDATGFLAECLRVLKPGGVLRMAIPDLEQIARHYLESVKVAWQTPEPVALANHQWMQMEMLDQLVRNQSGGEMGKILAASGQVNHSFIRSRLGQEIETAQSHKITKGSKPGFLAGLLARFRRKMLRLLLGKKGLGQWDVVNFRRSGEIHQWMYDRVSLRQILKQTGFESFSICEAQESRIADFESYGLDSRSGKVLKPDSIFVEALKPSVSRQAAA